MCRIAFDELKGIPVGQGFESFDDLRVFELVLSQQARLDVLRVDVFVHVSYSERANKMDRWQLLHTKVS